MLFSLLLQQPDNRPSTSTETLPRPQTPLTSIDNSHIYRHNSHVHRDTSHVHRDTPRSQRHSHIPGCSSNPIKETYRQRGLIFSPPFGEHLVLSTERFFKLYTTSNIQTPKYPTVFLHENKEQAKGDVSKATYTLLFSFLAAQALCLELYFETESHGKG